jgi:phosphatidylinositol alpha-1,6-mannosyltransferase
MFPHVNRTRAPAPLGAAGRRPRLLILTPDFPPEHGGIQVLTHRLACAMGALAPVIVTFDAAGARAFDAASGVRTRRVRAFGPAPARAALLNAVSCIEGLGLRPRAVLSMHVVTSPAAIAIGRSRGARVVEYFHANEVVAKPRLAAFAARRADAVIAVSAYTASLVRATGASPRDVRLIPNGVDIPEDPSPLAHGRPLVLTIARLNDDYKGHDVLIRALGAIRDRVPDVEWVVIGDGRLRGGLEELARACGVAGAIRFLGAVSDEERNMWLRRADVFAMPSRLPQGGLAGEGFGIVYLEAGAYGKPVVAGNVAGALDAVADGESGLLVDPCDPRAVGEAITRLLLDPDLAQRLGRQGFERARGFAWPVIARRVEAALLDTGPAAA